MLQEITQKTQNYSGEQQPTESSSSEKLKKIGFFINPIAGMGGKVGLKGTDNLVERAIALGAQPIAKERARETLSYLKDREDVLFLTCSGVMGEEVFKELKFPPERYKVIGYAGEKTSAEDTKQLGREFSKRNVDLILFAGGDGTARDIYEVIKRGVPLLGIPCGVKMFSSVFGINPKVTARVVKKFLRGEVEIGEGEILDVKEDKFRRNELDGVLFGYAKIPLEKILVQERKLVFHSISDERAKEDIAKFALEFLTPDTLYILGPGTTTMAIADALGVRASLLGVDVIKNEALVKRDVNEEQLLEILKKEGKAKILVSPLGAQGFIFGRGNQQISPQVIKKVGLGNIIILATPLKLSQTPHLLVDTGDKNLDNLLSGYKQVISGYKIAQRKKVEVFS